MKPLPPLYKLNIILQVGIKPERNKIKCRKGGKKGQEQFTEIRLPAFPANFASWKKKNYG